MKIVYICNFSNPEIRSRLELHDGGLRGLILHLLKRDINYCDYGVWSPLLLKGFERNQEIECHVIAPFDGMKKRVQEFTIRGVNYHFIRSSTTSLLRFIRYLNPKYKEKTDER